MTIINTVGVKEVLEQAIVLIETRGWFQKLPKQPDELCLVYALGLVKTDTKQLTTTCIHLLSILNKTEDGESTIPTLMEWNNTPGRTKEEVIDLLRKGIAACE